MNQHFISPMKSNSVKYGFLKTRTQFSFQSKSSAKWLNVLCPLFKIHADVGPLFDFIDNGCIAACSTLAAAENRKECVLHTGDVIRSPGTSVEFLPPSLQTEWL